MFRSYAAALFGLFVVATASEQAPDAGYTREQLQPLTKFRQQHRRVIDGRLCAAAFVQNRKAYTGCTEAPNPSGESGRPWCYVEPQVGALGFYTHCDCARSSSSSWATPLHGIIAVRFHFLAHARCLMGCLILQLLAFSPICSHSWLR